MGLLSAFLIRFPVARGMLTYLVLYPSANFAQQLMFHPSEIDTEELLRFALMGSCWVAPMMYSWVKISSRIFSATTNLQGGLKKALLEQVTYSPLSISTFYIGMNLLQAKETEEIKEELKIKFWPTYTTGMMYWPFVQTINYSLVSEKNRVPIVGMASFIWIIFLSFMKRQEVPTHNKYNDDT